MTAHHFNIKIASRGKTIVACPDFTVDKKKVHFLFGESGIGKSIISKCFYGLLEPDELHGEVNGRPYHDFLGDPWVKQVQGSSFFVFQEPSSHLNPLMKISEQLSEGSLGKGGKNQSVLEALWEKGSSRDIENILDLFPKPYRPSGGEKQRLLLAMAFKKLQIFVRQGNPETPTLFVFDEPTGSLDNRYRNQFLDLLFTFFRQCPFTALFITHDYSIISEVFKTHPDLVPAVCFSEVVRKGPHGAVAVNPFSPEDYSTWLRNLTPDAGTETDGNEVLRVHSSFRVFGRELHLSRDPSGVKPADLVIHKGETVYIKAPSGMGKTTLAKLIMGLYPSERFVMNLKDFKADEKTPLSQWPEKIWGRKAGMVFQHADEALNLAASVGETFKGLPVKLSPQQLTSHLEQFFSSQNIPAFLNQKVSSLSGGQKQRLNLLRTLVLGLDLIILDEPLNGLDFDSIRKVLSILDKKRREGCAFLMISHNEEIFEAMVDSRKIFYLKAG